MTAQCTLSGVGLRPGKAPASRAGIALYIQEVQAVPDSGEVRAGDEGPYGKGLAATQEGPGESVAPNHQGLGFCSTFSDHTQPGTGTQARPDRHHVVRWRMGENTGQCAHTRPCMQQAAGLQGAGWEEERHEVGHGTALHAKRMEEVIIKALGFPFLAGGVLPLFGKGGSGRALRSMRGASQGLKQSGFPWQLSLEIRQPVSSPVLDETSSQIWPPQFMHSDRGQGSVPRQSGSGEKAHQPPICRFPFTGPWLVTASTNKSQVFFTSCRATSGILPCGSTATPSLSRRSL